MKQSLSPNRNITMGDRGEQSIRTEFTKREQQEAQRQSIEEVKVRMRDWSDNFIRKIQAENSSPIWKTAAEEMLSERSQPVKKSKNYKKKRRH